MMDDILIVYPDGSYEVYNIHEEGFVIGRVLLEEQSGKFILDFIGKL